MASEPQVGDIVAHYNGKLGVILTYDTFHQHMSPVKFCWVRDLVDLLGSKATVEMWRSDQFEIVGHVAPSEVEGG